jgi:branched-chain amino acid transport system permease protein
MSQATKHGRGGGTVAAGTLPSVTRWLVPLIVTLFGPLALLSSYGLGLLVQSYIFAIVALITDVIWGYSGILTFASAAMFGIGTYSLGITFVHYSNSGWAILLALVGAMLSAWLLSALIGWLAFYSRTKVSEFYIAIVTLGLSVLFGQMALYGGALTGGSNGLSGFPTIALSNQAWYLIAAVALLLAIVIALRVVTSDFGLILQAVRDHEIRCKYLGIHTPRIKMAVFSICNALVAAVGVLYALFTTVVAPSLVGITLATNVLIWVMLGGRGTIVGPALAAVIINAATPELSTTMPLYWQGILGFTFIVVVVLLPRGLLPALFEFPSRFYLWVGRLNRLRRPSSKKWSPAHFEVAPTPVASNDGEVVLDVQDVSKHYGSFRALSNVVLQVRRGELLSVVGPNGAGKTSLVRCISDGLERTSGSIAICGQLIDRSPPDTIVGLGLGRKFQGASIFGSLTVGESLKIASWKGKTPQLWRRSDRVLLPPESAEVVNALNLREVWNVPAHDISHGQRQGLELAMVLALEPTVLLLDEPTAGLTTAERALIGDIVLRLVSAGRLAVVLIEHDFEFVKRISSRIVVLLGGKLLADGSVEEIANSELVREAYLGRERKGVAA